MKVSAWIFGLGTLFYAVVTVIYWVWTGEIIGTVLLALTGGMVLLISFYIFLTAARLGQQPEDNDLAEIDEADADYGFYSPHSWWPLPLAASCALVGSGFIFARWLMALGVICLVMSVIGLVFQYHRPEFDDVETITH